MVQAQSVPGNDVETQICPIVMQYSAECWSRSIGSVCDLWPAYRTFGFYPVLGLTMVGLPLSSKTKPCVSIPCPAPQKEESCFQVCMPRLGEGWWRKSAFWITGLQKSMGIHLAIRAVGLFQTSGFMLVGLILG
jgi:hypothetical protein